MESKNGKGHDIQHSEFARSLWDSTTKHSCRLHDGAGQLRGPPSSCSLSSVLLQLRCAATLALVILGFWLCPASWSDAQSAAVCYCQFRHVLHWPCTDTTIVDKPEAQAHIRSGQSWDQKRSERRALQKLWLALAVPGPRQNLEPVWTKRNPARLPPCPRQTRATSTELTPPKGPLPLAPGPRLLRYHWGPRVICQRARHRLRLLTVLQQADLSCEEVQPEAVALRLCLGDHQLRRRCRPRPMPQLLLAWQDLQRSMKEVQLQCLQGCRCQPGHHLPHRQIAGRHQVCLTLPSPLLCRTWEYHRLLRELPSRCSLRRLELLSPRPRLPRLRCLRLGHLGRQPRGHLRPLCRAGQLRSPFSLTRRLHGQATQSTLLFRQYQKWSRVVHCEVLQNGCVCPLVSVLPSTMAQVRLMYYYYCYSCPTTRNKQLSVQGKTTHVLTLEQLREGPVYPSAVLSLHRSRPPRPTTSGSWYQHRSSRTRAILAVVPAGDVFPCATVPKHRLPTALQPLCHQSDLSTTLQRLSSPTFMVVAGHSMPAPTQTHDATEEDTEEVEIEIEIEPEPITADPALMPTTSRWPPP